MSSLFKKACYALNFVPSNQRTVTDGSVFSIIHSFMTVASDYSDNLYCNNLPKIMGYFNCIVNKERVSLFGLSLDIFDFILHFVSYTLQATEPK